MNVPEFLAYTRKFLVALIAALGVLLVVLDNGVTASEWVQVAIAFLGALGVYAVPNAGPKE